MTKITQKVRSLPSTIQNHVKRNRVSYALGTALIGMTALQQKNVTDFYAFLVEKGIDPTEFYCPELYEELLKNK